MKILFLDFDGVLNGERFLRTQKLSPLYPALDPECCERVQRICGATGAKLVISSSWREIRTWDDDLERTLEARPITEIAAWLREVGITAEVVGATTGMRLAVDVKECRAQQLRAWVHAHAEVTRWCAVDDFRMTSLLGRGVQTHEEHGLREQDVERVIEMLGRVA